MDRVEKLTGFACVRLNLRQAKPASFFIKN
jgi:hypothetical protein